jgi:hypothetical protein
VTIKKTEAVGFTVWHCSRTPSRPKPPCDVCKLGDAVGTCAFELRGPKAGQCCGRKLCGVHATKRGDRFLCGAHAKFELDNPIKPDIV